MKFKIKTLGCRTNQYESEAIRRQLKGLGWSEAVKSEGADLCIVNTCTVTESADQRSRYSVRHLHKENPGAEIIVTGCSGEKNPADFKGLAGVTRVVSNQDKEELVQQLFPEVEVSQFIIDYFSGHTRAFLKVQDGCNSYCSYCVIPFVRGRSRSKPLALILDEARALIDQGYQEIVLTGINIGDYDGGKTKSSLSQLIKSVDKLPGLKRLRVSSIDPDEVDDPLIEAILEGENTCPSMHIVLQSGSNIILKRMRRKYTRQVFYNTIDKLQRMCPEFTFTTDLIVGFPGESEADFQDSLSVIKNVQFAKVHVFPYSDRPKTRASRFSDKIVPQEMKKRKAIIISESEKQAYLLRERYIGKELEVLTETVDKNDPSLIPGYTKHFLPVIINTTKNIKPNQLVTVKIKENSAKGMIAYL